MGVVIKALFDSLNRIEVRGKENLELLSGSIILVEKLQAYLAEVMKNGSQNPEGDASGEVCQPDDNP